MIQRLLVLAVLTIGSSVYAQSTGVKFFEERVRPVLVEHCYQCHSTKSGKARGGLKVDSKDALLRGGDSGPAIVPKSLTKSLLYQSILYLGDADYQMPPKGKLPGSVIADIRRWIEMGAPDPRVTKVSSAVKTEIDIEKGREFWAYVAAKQVAPNQTINTEWAQSTIDRHVIATLDETGLVPALDADPKILVRRLYFTLTGLPPSATDVETWTGRLRSTSNQTRTKDSPITAKSPIDQHSFAELVDSLLTLPQYGERWGRHWMDVARYAESTGGDQNNIYQHAWRYRDYVIDSFNSDKPFDQFIREQIAGDLLPIESDEEWANNVIATGFLDIGVKLVGEDDQQKFLADLVDEQIDSTTRALLATTVACARCHDHKFDPIPQADYYALASIFRATTTHYGLIKAQARQSTTLLDLTGLGPPPGTPSLTDDEYDDLIAERDNARAELDDAMKKIRSGVNVFRGALRRLRSRRDETEAALLAYSENGEPRVFAMGTQDREFPLPTRLLVRGELDKPAQLVAPGVPQVLSKFGKHTLQTRSKDSLIRLEMVEQGLGLPTRSGSGRLQLAQWISSKSNPLTARVIANRVWHWMFGRGLVRTVDDFGATGDRPTHPELLDYLALRLVQHNWSIKSLIREIALSRTWQLSSTFNATNFAVDPDNVLLWRAHKRRLEAEVVRDAMLMVSGRLDLKRPLGTYLNVVGEGNVGQNVFEPVIRKITANTRSVYLPRVRNVLPEMLEVFDAPDAGLVSGTRETTSSPLQALFLMNNEFVQQCAEGLASRVVKLPVKQRLSFLYQVTLGREPSDRERELAVEFTRELSDSSDLTSSERIAALCHAIISTSEFRTID